MSKKTHTPRVGRPPEWRTPRKQLTLLLPVSVHDKVKQYAKKISEPYKIKANAVTS
jgi:hypothetical protein